MSIIADWPNYIFHVPRADMTLIQSSPTEIRECNINWLRLQIMALEDDPNGMTFPTVWEHYPEVDVGTLTLAKSILMNEPYTITFEDGQYAVNLVGANSNIGDRVNVNQVSVRLANSAGMVSSPDIEYSSFDGAVHIDVTTSNTGTIFPTGTPRKPVNNIDDALLIDDYRGFKKLKILKSMTGSNALGVGGVIELTGFEIYGRSAVNTYLEILSDAICSEVTIKECNITGTLDGGTHLSNCRVGSIDFMNGYIENSGLYGTIVLGGNTECTFNNCIIVDQDTIPIIDMNFSGQDLSMPNYTGIVKIRNLSSASEEIGIGLNAGLVILEPSITDGTIIVSGNGLLYDYSNLTLPNKVNVSGLVNQIAVEYNRKVVIDTETGSSGSTYPLGTLGDPVDNVADALILAEKYNCEVIHLHSSVTFTTGMDISKKIIEAHKSLSLTVTLESGVEMKDTEFTYLRVTGVSGHKTIYQNCFIMNLTNLCGIFKECGFMGSNACEDSLTNQVIMKDCRAIDRAGTILNVGQAFVTIQEWISHLILDNKYGINNVNVHSLMSKVTVNDTCVEGIINLSGTGYPADNSAAGCTVLTDKLNNRDIQADASSTSVWSELIETGYTAEQIMKVAGAILAGKVSGAGTSTETFRSISDDRDAITSTVDSSGNRTNIVTDV